MTKDELIEVLLLRNRGVLHSRVFEPFDADSVSTVYLGLIERGHLVEVVPPPGENRSYMPLGFHVEITPAGRARLETLERMLAPRTESEEK